MLISLYNRSLEIASKFSTDYGSSLFSLNYISLTVTGTAILYCLWWLWRFTILPYFRPEEPKEIPYWIPFLGHGLSFFGSSHSLIERGLDYTGRTHEPFALQVGPETLYIVTDPKDITEVYKKADTLVWEDHLNELFLNFGFDRDSLKRAWVKPVKGSPIYVENNPVNPNQLSLIHLVENTYAKQLLPGLRMDKMSQGFVKSLKASQYWSHIDFSPRAGLGCRTVSLKTLCQYTLLEAGIHSFFGPKIFQLDSNILPTFLEFSANAWMLFYGLPSTLASAVMKPRRCLIKTFARFASLPESQRSDQSWSVEQILIAQEIVGIDVDSRACMLIMILWAANSNVNNIAFWVLAHIVHDKPLSETVKAEVNAAWKSGELDIKSLCANSPVLNNTLHECLRLYAGAMMGRKVSRPTRIGGKLLRPGASVLIPSRQLHSNEDVWGTNHRQFDSERFARNEGLLKHSSYRPFGGGVSWCPGRKIAREQVFALVAIVFNRFDILPCQEKCQKIPSIDISVPALGILGPDKKTDYLVDLKDIGKGYRGVY